MGENVHKSTKTSGYAAKNDTEAGLTRDQRTRVLDWENKHANNKYESLVAFDKSGKVALEVNGDPKKPSQVSWTGQGHKLKDTIISHNHPGVSIKKEASKNSIAAGINGYPFSPPDINTAISNDALGIRARTGNYIFSIQRGKSGWGKATAKDYADTLRKIEKSVNLYSSLPEQQDIDRLHRTIIGIHHSALKDFAQRNGLKYTRRKAR